MSLPAFLLVLHLIPESEKLAEMGIRLALTVGGAFLLMQLASLLVGRVQHWMVRAGHDRPGSEQRAKTVGQTLRSLLTTLVWAGAFVHALEIFGWDVKPLLAGAGILGVALGFGAQTLVRDLIAGFFILVENQFAVGELVEVNGQPALVEEVTLRSTRLRSFNGFVHYVPNGEFKTVTNRSREWNRLTVDVPVGANEDLGRALAAVPRGRGRAERRAGLARAAARARRAVGRRVAGRARGPVAHGGTVPARGRRLPGGARAAAALPRRAGRRAHPHRDEPRDRHHPAVRRARPGGRHRHAQENP